jgi:hypothetical protein
MWRYRLRERRNLKAVAFWAKLYASRIQAGDEYEVLMPCIGINVLNFVMFPNFPGFHACFLLRENDNPGMIMTEDEKLRDLALRREMWRHDQATLLACTGKRGYE